MIFHSRGRALAVLSNFAPHVLTIGGRRFACGEAYFHFAKFLAAATAAESPERATALRAHAEQLADKPKLPPLTAKRLGGKGKPHGCRLEAAELAAWDAVRYDTQLALCRALAHDAAGAVRTALLGTGRATLVHFERGATADSYWGGKVVAGGAVVGQNTLGKIWMRLRGELAAATGAGGGAGAAVAAAGKRGRAETKEGVATGGGTARAVPRRRTEAAP